MSEHIIEAPYADEPEGEFVSSRGEFTDFELDPDSPSPVGMLLDEERGTLPYALIHGEALVACAAWAMGDAGVLPADAGTQWEDLRDHVVENESPLVLHDPLCPMTPAEFISDCVAQAHATNTVVVGVRPVTDTVKTVRDGLLGETVDRENLRLICSPVVLPAAIVGAMESLPTTLLDVLVPKLREHFPVALVTAPPQARRITGVDDLRLLEELTRNEARD